MYFICVRHTGGFTFKTACRTVEDARRIESELSARFPSFEGYAVGAYVVEGNTTKAVCL